MDWVTLALGVAVVAGAFADLILVAVSAQAVRTPSRAVGRGVFAAVGAVGRATGGRAPPPGAAGPIVLMAVALFWIAGLWLGWALIFASGDSLTLEPVGVEVAFWDHLSHAGHLLNTLGGANTRPVRPVWPLLDVVAGINGMVALTLAVSFVMGTRETVSAGRAFAALADDPDVAFPTLRERAADLVASLQAAPFALFYTTARADRRTPDAMEAYARRATAEGPAAAARMRDLLAELPGWDDGAADFDASLRAWVGAHLLDPRERRAA